MRQTGIRLLAAVPILALIGALPFVNRVEPLVLGLPFLLFWMLAWVMATPVFLGLAYALSRRCSELPGRPRTRHEAEGGSGKEAGSGWRHRDGGGRHVDGGGR